jgi:hypothetical protein
MRKKSGQGEKRGNGGVIKTFGPIYLYYRLKSCLFLKMASRGYQEEALITLDNVCTPKS